MSGQVRRRRRVAAVDRSSPTASPPLRMWCAGAPSTVFRPACREFRVRHPCTRLASKSCTHAPHLHRQASSSLPHTSPAPALLPLRREGCGMHHALPSSPRRSTPLRPQVVILDFLDTFSSSSRRWCRQCLLYLASLRSDSRRAVCVVGGTGEGVACRRARYVNFFVDDDLSFIDILLYQAHRAVIYTPRCRGQVTRPRQLCVCNAVEGTHH